MNAMESSDTIREILIGTLSVVGALGAGPVGAIAGAAVSPIIVDALTVRGVTRIDVMRLFALDEVRRREQAGERLRSNLKDPTQVADLLEGAIVRARDAYESHKCKHLAYFIVKVLFDDHQDLPEAFYQLNLAERLTYHQYVLFRAFQLSTDQPEKFNRSTEPFGDNPSPPLAQILLPMLDLFNQGLLIETEGDNRPAVGALASRFNGTSLSLSNPAGVRLSALGSKFAENLGLHLVPEDLLKAIELRLKA
jgi:hypothetical protein